MAQIFGQLEKAQLENLTVDPSGAGLVPGRIWYRTDSKLYKVYDGVAVQTFVDLSTAQTLSSKTLASPTLTGTPVAPTATLGTNTTQIATTAFVLANAAQTPRNYAINGNLEAWQRGAAAKSIPSGTTNAVFHADRIGYKVSAASAGTVTSSRITSATSGITNISILPASCQFFQELNVTIPDTTVAAGAEGALYLSPLEGYDLYRMIDESNVVANGVTISFYLYIAVTGTYTVEVYNSSTDNRYFTTITVTTANRFERYSVYIPTIQTSVGTWNLTNGLGLGIKLWLIAGSNFIGATQNAWTGSATANVPAGQANFFGTTGNKLGFTGLSISAGNYLVDFKTRGDGVTQEQFYCRRYYEKSYPFRTDPATINIGGFLTAIWLSANRPFHLISFIVEKRSTPTVTIYNYSTGATGTLLGEQTSTAVTAGVQDATSRGFGLFQSTASSSNNAGALGHYSADAEVV